VARIDGNLPGRQEAGNVWQACYTLFLVEECEMEQSTVDRQLFFKRDKEGDMQMIAAIHVDDNMNLVFDRVWHAWFSSKWHKRFGGTPPTSFSDTVGFLGLEYTDEGDSVTVGSPKLMAEMARLLSSMESTTGAPQLTCTHKVPLPVGSLDQLTTVAAEVGQEVKKAAWSVHGLSGFMAQHYRPDVIMAYVAVAQQVAHNLTPYVYRCIAQIARYGQHGDLEPHVQTSGHLFQPPKIRILRRLVLPERPPGQLGRLLQPGKGRLSGGGHELWPCDVEGDDTKAAGRLLGGSRTHPRHARGEGYHR
jgi:hypothetical protein